MFVIVDDVAGVDDDDVVWGEVATAATLDDVVDDLSIPVLDLDGEREEADD